MFQVHKPIRIQTLVSEPTIKALGISVFDRLPRSNKVQFHTFAISPFIQDTPGKLGAIIDGNDFR